MDRDPQRFQGKCGHLLTWLRGILSWFATLLPGCSLPPEPGFGMRLGVAGRASLGAGRAGLWVNLASQLTAPVGYIPVNISHFRFLTNNFLISISLKKNVTGLHFYFQLSCWFQKCALEAPNRKENASIPCSEKLPGKCPQGSKKTRRKGAVSTAHLGI